MASSLKPYPAYKPSGVEWLGAVPEYWEVRKLRRTLRAVTKRNRSDLPLLSVVREKGVVLRDVSNKDENHNFIPDDLTNYKVVQHGQFAMNKMKAWQGSYGVSKLNGIVSPAYFVFYLDRVDGDYFHTAIRSKAYVPYFTQASDGVRIGQWDLSLARMREISFLVPPLAEQAAIARYLDCADRRIRRCIQAKERLIELLEEQRQALVHEAVTGRVDVRTSQPYPACKPSGVEWLGAVPAHWEVRRLGNAVTMRVSNVDKHVREGETPVRLCNYVDVYKNDCISQRIDFMRATATPGEIAQFRLEEGDVLITKDSEAWDDIGVPAVVTEPAEDLISGYHLALLRPFAGVLIGGYLLRTLQSKGLAHQFHVEAKGVTRYGLSHASIKSVWLAVPPLAEQAAIARYLDRADRRIRRSIQSAQRQVELLNEYRTRLIADVVTGKLDVREAAAGLPEVEPLAAENADDIPNEDAAAKRSGLDAAPKAAEAWA